MFVVFGSTCGEEFSASNGTITTPYYPGSFPIGEECTWTVNGPEGRHILIYIEDLRLASSPFLGSDTVTVCLSWFYRPQYTSAQTMWLVSIFQNM